MPGKEGERGGSPLGLGSPQSSGVNQSSSSDEDEVPLLSLPGVQKGR